MLAPTITSPLHQSQLQISEIQRCWKGQIPFESERSLHKVSLGKKQERCLEPVVPNSDWLCSSEDQTHNKSLKECKFHIPAELSVASAYVGKNLCLNLSLGDVLSALHVLLCKFLGRNGQVLTEML